MNITEDFHDAVQPCGTVADTNVASLFGAGTETARSSQMSGNFYRPTKYHIPEGFEFYVKHPVALVQNDTTDTSKRLF